MVTYQLWTVDKIDTNWKTANSMMQIVTFLKISPVN